MGALEEVYGYADGDSDESSMDGADIDWVFLFILGVLFLFVNDEVELVELHWLISSLLLSDMFILASILYLKLFWFGSFPATPVLPLPFSTRLPGTQPITRQQPSQQ